MAPATPLINVLLFMLASEVCLAAAIALAWKWFTAIPDLHDRLAKLREFASRKKRVAFAQVLLERARAESASLQRSIERVRQLVLDRIEMGDPEQLMLSAIAFAIVTLVLFSRGCSLDDTP